jgi:hypothetical protein
MKKLPTITLSEVLKKDLKLIGFLVLNGGVVYLSQTVLKDNVALAVVFGAAANYIAYRLQQELANEGYKRALTN